MTRDEPSSDEVDDYPFVGGCWRQDVLVRVRVRVRVRVGGGGGGGGGCGGRGGDDDDDGSNHETRYWRSVYVVTRRPTYPPILDYLFHLQRPHLQPVPPLGLASASTSPSPSACASDHHRRRRIRLAQPERIPHAEIGAQSACDEQRGERPRGDRRAEGVVGDGCHEERRGEDDEEGESG
jgi:hypothetical protein